MHEGFINFNAGTEGPGMIEGRISAGVWVGTGSDLGGDALLWARYQAAEISLSRSVENVLSEQMLDWVFP